MHIEPRDNVSSFRELFELDQNSEAFQQKIADFFPAIIYVYDASQKKLRFINRRLTDLLGYSYEDIQEMDHDLMKVIYKDDISLVQKELERFDTLKDNNTHFYTCRLNHKEGNWLYFRTQGIILKRSADGAPASLLFIAQDVTQQMLTEEEAKASKALLNETEDLLLFGTWTWDLVTDKVEWSQGLYNLLGYSNEDFASPLTNADFTRHVDQNQLSDLEETIQNAIRNKTDFKKTFTLRSKDQREKIVSTLGKVVTSSEGNAIKILGVTRDITDQVLLNREQQELKNHLAKYKESMIEKERLLDFGSLELDLLKKELHWSDGMYLLFGYDPVTDKENLKINRDFYKIHMSDAEISSSVNQLNEALKSKDNYIIETSITSKQGAAKRLETYGKVERLPTGEPYKVIGITRDVTRLKEYEKNLERKIDELDRSNKELEEFAYIASHDLQEPLRKITAFSERLQEKSGNEISQEGQLYLQRIMAATQNMRLLIDNLLEFSRTSRHNQAFERIDLNIVLNQVISDLELKIEDTKTSINSSEMPVVAGIHSQLIQLFTNIISNAIKFRKQSEPSVINIGSEILSPKEKASHFLPPEKKYYKITIIDSGIGFEQEYALRIFQIFQRLHGKAEYPGSGIGLAICKKIVDNHNGIIYAEGVPGQGSTFTFILPENQY